MILNEDYLLKTSKPSKPPSKVARAAMKGLRYGH
jgi:hypothetical protein